MAPLCMPRRNSFPPGARFEDTRQCDLFWPFKLYYVCVCVHSSCIQIIKYNSLRIGSSSKQARSFRLQVTKPRPEMNEFLHFALVSLFRVESFLWLCKRSPSLTRNLWDPYDVSDSRAPPKFWKLLWFQPQTAPNTLGCANLLVSENRKHKAPEEKKTSVAEGANFWIHPFEYRRGPFGAGGFHLAPWTGS